LTATEPLWIFCDFIMIGIQGDDPGLTRILQA